jgi:hypothetical protein
MRAGYRAARAAVAIAVRRDPDFDSARDVENPTCPWRAWIVNANGVDCRAPVDPAGSR